MSRPVPIGHFDHMRLLIFAILSSHWCASVYDGTTSIEAYDYALVSHA